jgi:CRP/FNR family transcriptional regulator, anaerobic regulatory protein
MKDADREQLSKRFPSLSDPALLDAIARTGQRIQVPVGHTICDVGQACSHLALVFDGTARIYQLAETGREITLYRVGPGECCILTAACIMSQQGFPAIASTERTIDALLIPAAQVDEWMGAFAQWRRFVWTLMSDRLSNVLCLLEEVTFHRVDQRIISYLLRQTEAQRNASLNVTHQVIADDVGTSREVVSRILKDLEQRALLSLSRGQLRVDDRAGLQALLALCD